MAPASSAPRKRKRKARSASPAPGGPQTPEVSSGAEPERRRAAADTESLPRVDLVREQRLGWFAGAAAVGVVLLTIGAVPVAAAGAKIHAPSGSAKALLLGVGRSGDSQAIAMYMRVASTLLLIPIALFLYDAIRGRNPKHYRFIPIVGIVGFVVVSVSTVIGFYATRHAAHVFLASGPRTLARASHLHSSQSALRLADVGSLLGAIVFGLWVSICAYEMMQIGLLTRFLGILGVAGGLASAVPVSQPFGPPLFLAWLGSTGVLMLGWWPGGTRPPAWEAGRAVSLSEADELEASGSRGAMLR